MSEFDCIVVCDTENERKELVQKLKDFEGYSIKEEQRDWVNMSFAGVKKEGEMFPQQYMDLHDFLVTNGFVQKRSYWGSRRFEKKETRGQAEEKPSE